MKKLVNNLLQKDPLRRPEANYLVEIVPDFIEFIADSSCVEDNNEFVSSSSDFLNRYVSVKYIILLIVIHIF